MPMLCTLGSSTLTKRPLSFVLVDAKQRSTIPRVQDSYCSPSSSPLHVRFLAARLGEAQWSNDNRQWLKKKRGFISSQSPKLSTKIYALPEAAT